MRVAAILLVMLASCATVSSPGPALPPPTDLDALLPPAPKLAPIPTDLPDGPTTSVDDGQCSNLPGGYWVAERSYTVLVAKAAELEQRRVESTALRQLRATERTEQAVREQAFRAAITSAEASARWRLWIGVAVGAGAVLLGAWTAGQVSR